MPLVYFFKSGSAPKGIRHWPRRKKAPRSLEPRLPKPGLVESFVGSYPVHVLETLLADRTTGRNIVWVNDEYPCLAKII